MVRLPGIYSLYWLWGFFIACVHIHFHNLFNSYNFKLKSSFAIYIQIFLLHWADFLELHIYIIIFLNIFLYFKFSRLLNLFCKIMLLHVNAFFIWLS